MIVYRSPFHLVSTRSELDRLADFVEAGVETDFLVALGELEQGVVDSLHPDADGWGPIEAGLRRAMLHAGAAFLARRAGRPPDGFRDARRELATLPPSALPDRIEVHPPEGYAHYALDPGGYAAAATAYFAEVGAERASRAVVIGIRSIGTSLSAVVAAAIGSERSITVRPRGRPGQRWIQSEPSLQSLLARWLPERGDALIVDEGPGATGETLDVVATWLRGMGWPGDRIVLFVSRTWGMPLAGPDRRAWFEAARKYVPPGNDLRPAALAARLGASHVHDLSAGRWREVIPGAHTETASVGHERIKVLATDDHGTSFLIRYAGLGRWGKATTERATRLASAGHGPEFLGIEEGFLIQRWIEGSPLRRADCHDPTFLATLADYLSDRAGILRTGRVVDRVPTLEMLVENAEEAFGGTAPGLAAAVRRLEELPAREAVIADARLQPREWIATAHGFRKVDALDHGDGLRLPGPTDAAWDLAGAAVELGLDAATVAEIARRQARATGDETRELLRATAAYRAPYTALRLAEARLAAWEATTDLDRHRLEAEAAAYHRALADELERAANDREVPRAA